MAPSGLLNDKSSRKLPSNMHPSKFRSSCTPVDVLLLSRGKWKRVKVQRSTTTLLRASVPDSESPYAVWLKLPE